MTGFGLKLDKSALKNVKVKERSAEEFPFQEGLLFGRQY